MSTHFTNVCKTHPSYLVISLLVKWQPVLDTTHPPLSIFETGGGGLDRKKERRK